MRDPRIGAFGACALVISLLTQIFTLSALQSSKVLSVGVAAHAASRGYAGLALYLPPATEGGLGATFSGATGKWSPAVSLLIGAAIAVVLLRDAWAALAIAALVWGLLALVVWRRLGGITGDAIGALQQVTLFTILVGATVL